MRRFHRLKASAVSLLALAPLAVAAPAFAQSADEQVAPLADGFPSRPIVLMVIDEPGSTDSVFANQLAESANVISPQRVIVEHRVDFSNFGTWEAIAWIKDQGELGSEGYINYVYTLPDAMVDLGAVDIKEMTGVFIEDMNAVIATEQVPFLMIQRADAPWGDTLEEFVAHAKANPGTIRHITGGPGGGQDAAMRVWARHLGIELNDIIGGSPGERALAVASGEGDVTVSPVDTVIPHHDAGRVTVLMASGDNVLPDPWQGVPNAESLGMADDPFNQTRTIGVSSEVSDEHREWLNTLFARAAEREDYLAKRQNIKALTTVRLDHDEATTFAQSGYDTVVPIFRELGIYWEDLQ